MKEILHPHDVDATAAGHLQKRSLGVPSNMVVVFVMPCPQEIKGRYGNQQLRAWIRNIADVI